MVREVSFNFKDNIYKVKIDNVGQWQDIQKLKTSLSSGMYGQMMSEGTIDSLFALDMIDIQSTMSAICPKFVEEYKGIESLRDLNFADAMELREAYRNQIAPYINEIRKMLNPIKEEKEGEE